MLTFIGWVTVGVLAAGTVLGIWILLRAFQFVYVRVTPAQVDDSESVLTSFIQFLSEARTSMVVYDHGDDMGGSLYNDQRAIDAVCSKLRANPGFRLQCLLNCNHDVKFRKELANEERVDIRTRIDSGNPSGIYYMMIDGGVKAYLSRHAPGSRDRRFKIVDCTSVSRRHLSRVVEGVLGKHRADFSRAFNVARDRGNEPSGLRGIGTESANWSWTSTSLRWCSMEYSHSRSP